MPDGKTHLLKTWFEEVWNKGRESAIDELASPDMVAHGLLDASGKPITGTVQFKEFWRGFRETFPDIHVDVQEALSDGDKEIVRCVVRATHKGGGLGIAATHKSIKFTGVVIAREKNGQLVEAWDHWDFLGLYQQLGAVPASIV
ncbi:MAG TPA: ester cyclase [Chthoniobacter sp.]|nr:ester cyclase [Chthoniobacter sp.]